jgi:sugar lactone lactonase YvrE
MITIPNRFKPLLFLTLTVGSGAAFAQEFLYVADDGFSEVYRYPLPSSTPSTFATGFNGELFGIATGAAGQLYTVNNIGNLIQRFQPDGSLAPGFGTAGQVDIKSLTSDQAFGPVGVAYSPAGGSLVISAYNSGHLIRLDAGTGAWDMTFGTGGLLDVGDEANFERPIGVAYNTSGNFIYYTREDGTIRRVASDGTGDVALNLNGAAPSIPYGLALLSDTELFITDIGMNQVLKFIVNGTDATLDASYDGDGRVDVPDGVFGLAVASSGVAYVTGGSVVSRISPTGGSVDQFITGLSTPTGIALHVEPVPETSVHALAVPALVLAGLWIRRRSV